jgi:hypothetical protein
MPFINLVDAFKFYKGTEGQTKAAEYLNEILNDEEKTAFQTFYREPEKEKPKQTNNEIYIYAKWSGEYDEFGLKIFGMYLMNGDKAVDKLPFCSGQSYAQDVVWPLDDTSGSMRPLPEGIYDLGAVDDVGYDPGASDGYGQWVYPLEPRAAIQRSLLRVHSDRNRSTSPGSAGCATPYTVSQMFAFVGWTKQKNPPKYFVMDHGLGFLNKEQGFTAPEVGKP